MPGARLVDKRNLRAVKVAYDKICAEYARRSFQPDEEEPAEHQILNLFLKQVEEKVCDVGCGPGHNTCYVRDLGMSVMGVDLSAGMVAEARRRNPGIEFLQASMYHLPVGNASWGAILALHSIIHIPRGEVISVLQEFNRVLRPGGMLLLAFYLGEKTLTRLSWGNVSVEIRYTHFRPTEMEHNLTKAGFMSVANLDLKGFEGSAACRYVFARKEPVDERHTKGPPTGGGPLPPPPAS